MSFQIPPLITEAENIFDYQELFPAAKQTINKTRIKGAPDQVDGVFTVHASSGGFDSHRRNDFPIL